MSDDTKNGCGYYGLLGFCFLMAVSSLIALGRGGDWFNQIMDAATAVVFIVTVSKLAGELDGKD